VTQRETFFIILDIGTFVLVFSMIV
jgi:hypothetical protein